MKKLITLISIILLTFLKVTSASTIYVDCNATGANNGTSWANAYTSLQTALGAATSGDQIWIAAGTYKPGTTRDSYFAMIEDVKIYGGFAGNETAVNQRTGYGVGEANETILSGDINGDDVITGSGATLSITNNEDNCYHVICNNDNGLTSAALLDGVTITGGNANKSISPQYYGGGMHNDHSSPNLNNVTFSKNSAGGGGGLYNNNESIPNLTNVTFCNNKARGGGGIYNIYGASTCLTNVTFFGNSASDGGGICNIFSSPTLNNCILWGNTASNRGNEIYNYEGTVTLYFSCYGNGIKDIYGTLTADENCITTNPHFADATNGDYRLTGNSLCVDTGNDSFNNEPYDIRGSGFNRKQGTIDMGAYEYKAGTDPAEIYLIFYVNDNATGANNGISWANAYTSLQDAHSAAISGDQIWIAAGTYKPGTSRFDHFSMKEGVKIYGGFHGNENAVDERTDFGYREINETILSGNIGHRFNSKDDCFNVFFNDNITSAALLDGVTIKRGYAYGDDTYCNGGGMFNKNSSPTLTNITFIENFAREHGGGMYNCKNSSPTLTNVTIDYSMANYGGGMYNDKSSPTLINVNVNDNYTYSDGAGIYNNNSSPNLINVTLHRNWANCGGGMYNENSSPNFKNVTISDNVAYFFCGGIYNKNSSPSLFDVTINNNSETGIYNENSSPNLNDVSIRSNHDNGICNVNSSPSLINVAISSNKGNGIYNDNSSPSLNNVTINSNHGSGIFNVDSRPILTNVSIQNNSSRHGGGICNENSSPILNNVTISRNHAEFGGGMGNFNSSPTLNNCIVYGNTSTFNGNEIYINGAGTTTLNYTCYSNDTNDIYNDGGTLNADANCITSNPHFVDAANGDFRIKGRSPCADAGNDSYNNEPFDIRGEGYGRKLSKTNHTQPGTIDMGAYEYKEGTDPVGYAPPTIITQAVTSITTNTATGNGNITDLGYPEEITAYGVCWNTTGMSTTAGSNTNEGVTFSTGYFSSGITGLTAGTTYYVRAYATNNTGTAYGDEVSFTTPNPVVEFTSTSQTSLSENGILTITAKLSEISNKNVTIPFSVNTLSTARGNGIDYTITASPVTIPAGETTVDIIVTIVDDDLVEGDETIIIDMEVTTNAFKGALTSHTITITDNDNALISIFPETLAEEGGLGNFTVSSTKRFQELVIMDIKVSGSANEGADYAPIYRQFVLPPYMYNAPIEITAVDDRLVEGTETISVNLDRIITGLGEVDTLASEATLEIIDNDFATISVTSTGEIDEGEQGFFNITLDKATEHPFTVTTGLSGNATEGEDFSPIRREVNIPAGLLHVGVQLNSIPDLVNEGNENVNMELFSTTNGNVIVADTPGNMATMIIIDDDPQPGISVDSASASEGAGTLAFSIELSAPSGKTVNVSYETSGTGSATPETDYAETSGTLEFLPGETEKTIGVTVIDDLLFENDETFNLLLHDVVNATIDPDMATGIIVDNDLEPPVAALQFSRENILENGGKAYIKAILDKPAGVEVTIGYSLTGDAVENEDFFNDASGNIVIPKGETADSVLITFFNDEIVEPDEQLIANLDEIINATQGIPVTDTLVILNQDQAITFGELAGATYGDAPFNLSGSTTSGLDVNYSSSNLSVATISGDMLTITGAGTVTATASQPGNEIYEPAVEITRELTVEKAKLQVTARDVEKTYGEENPEFTLSYSGFVNSDNKSMLNTVPLASTTATQTSSAGNYTITFDNGEDSNYSFVYIEGKFTINKASQAITFIELPEANSDNSPVQLTATASSGLDVYFESSNESVAYIERTTAIIVGSGETIITAQQDGNWNYLPAEGVTRLLTVGTSGIGWPTAYGPLCYPNPFSNAIYLNAACSNDALVQVFDTNGKKLLEKTCPTGTIYCGSLRNGPYLLKVTLQNGESFSRLIVKE
ncbi:MAG: T9SS type A sorting domain-containing protein [Prolixibacteraceae bacterium]|nr:T9SS type A sorting domain-containing protein [Prolixibacteraceae bacterium]